MKVYIVKLKERFFMKKRLSMLGIIGASFAMAIAVGASLMHKGEVREAKAETVDYTSIGTGLAGKETVGGNDKNIITWTLGGGITITQHQGSANAAVNTSYNTASSARIYIGHVVSIEAATGYSIIGVKFTNSTSSSYYGADIKASTSWSSLSTAISENDAENLTLTNCTGTTSGLVSTIAAGGTNENTSVNAIYFSVTRQARPSTFTISYIKPDTGAPTEVVCSAQSVDVASKLDLSNEVSFLPNGASCGLSYSIKTGTDKIDLSGSIITGKKSGSVTVTITPADTSKGAAAIDVTITVNAISAPGITVGDQFAIFADDTENEVKVELTGSTGTGDGATIFTGSIPSCSYVLDTEAGYYENTISFKNGSTYLSLNSEGNNLNTKSSVMSESSWIVTWDSTSLAATVENAHFRGRFLEMNYNKGNPKFACYVGTQVNVSLYKYVEKALEDFSLPASFEVYKTETAPIEVTYNPADAVDKTLTWSSQNETIATVDDGAITGVNVGTTTVTATKTIQGVKVVRTCSVTVLNNQSEHRGTQADPFNVNDAMYVAKGILVTDPDDNPINIASKDYYVKGQITAAVSRTTTQLTFFVGDNDSQISTATGAFEIFKAGKVRGVALGEAYADNNALQKDINVGNIVLVKGTFVFYNSATPETSQGTADIVWSDYLEAKDYAIAFNQAIGGVCDSEGATVVSTLAGAWSTQSTNYSSLSDEAKYVLRTASASSTENATDVRKCAAKYDYVAGKYRTQLMENYDFMGRNPKAINSGFRGLNIISEESNSVILIIVLSSVAVISLGFVIALKKKKHN